MGIRSRPPPMTIEAPLRPRQFAKPSRGPPPNGTRHASLRNLRAARSRGSKPKVPGAHPILHVAASGEGAGTSDSKAPTY